MKTGIRVQRSWIRAAALTRVFPGFALAALITACHSSHIEVTVENRTGGPIRLLEIDYPSASFGADSLAADRTMHYRIQAQGTGPVKVLYTSGNGTATQISGPDLAENQEGALSIVLLPGGKAEFQPRLARNK